MRKRKLTAEDVAAIREAWDTGKTKSVETLGAKYGVSVTTITAIVTHRTWRDLAYRIKEDENAA